jgi:hypothetical protein
LNVICTAPSSLEIAKLSQAGIRDLAQPTPTDEVLDA